MKIKANASIDKMLDAFNRRIDKLEGYQSEHVESTKKVDSGCHGEKKKKEVEGSAFVEENLYIDENGNAFGEAGLTYTEKDLREYFDKNKGSDPILQGYESFEDWLTDTIDNGLLVPHYPDVAASSVEEISDEMKEITGAWDGDPEMDNDLDALLDEDLTTVTDDWIDDFDLEESQFEFVDKKSVHDSDGFLTDYTFYHDILNNRYVMVFGDEDIYKPEDGYFDAEFDTYEEAREWFDNYTGFEDEEDFF